jgi:NADH-quinone oxidoreductase subunit H
MRFGWKVLIPANLVWILTLAGVRTVQDRDLTTLQRVLWIGVPVLIALAIWMFWPARKQTDENPGITGVDATGRVGGTKGFPVPPLDLEVPPSPRAERVLVGRTSPSDTERETVSMGKES